MSTSITQFNHLRITLDEILKATNNFSEDNIIGRGDFGYIYEGQLLHSGELINVSAKRLDRSQGLGDIEFLTEVSVLSGLKHPNIVSLIGFCDEKGEKIIITRLEPNGGLCMYLDDPALTWIQRLKISIGIGRAISYLHSQEGRNYSIIHCNLNSSTILLDDNFEAKLSGFEFSIKGSVDRTERYIPSEVVDVQGYMDPDTIKSGDVTQKSDIYSFGVILCEIMCGRKAFLPNESEDNKFLAPLVRFHDKKKTLHDIIHPDISNQVISESLDMFASTACVCISEDHLKRQDMIMHVFFMERALKQESEIIPVYILLKEGINLFSHLPSDGGIGAMVGSTSSGASQAPFSNKELKQFFGEDLQALLGKDMLRRCIKVLQNRDKVEIPKVLQHMYSSCARSEQELRDMDETTTSGARKENSFEHLRIPLADIQLATNNFSEESKLRDTKLYSCYTGDLECFDRKYDPSLENKNKGELPKRRYKDVRIKCIKDANTEAMFHTEIEILSTCKHNNIVSLLGFCDEGRHMILVYEGYRTNRSLQSCLDHFNWESRVTLCDLIARGLNYIHNEMEDQKVVIHRQINTETIFVDDKSGVKVSGFGLSTFLSSTQDEDNEQLRKHLLNPSTTCYIAPEFLDSGKATKESDVYSFGIVMLEMLCTTSYDILSTLDAQLRPEHGFKYGIIKQKMGRKIKEENSGNKLFLKKGPNEDSLDIFIRITQRCLAVNPEQRPTFQVIMKELRKALTFQENHKDNLRMSLEDIKSATQNFSNDVGGGGFGRVYKGKFASEYGSYTIVAKRLDKSSKQGDQQFYNELHILSEYKHENIIRLIGYNNDEQERIAVYEYASRGSLDYHLKDDGLTWVNRLNICIDIARGLAFIHGGVREHEAVIHRDMKTANILLFDDWKAKVADFGLSLIYIKNEETEFVIDHVCGTRGYLDPLYQKSRFLTKESDIYSFGVVLFEILYGKSTYEIHERERQFLQSLVKQCREEGRLDEVVFNAIKNQIVPEALATFQAIAYQCLHDDREKRPTAQHVLVQLQNAMELQVIKDEFNALPLPSNGELGAMAESVSSQAWKGNKFEHLRIRLTDIQLATNNFSKQSMLEKTMSYSVYKGDLECFDRESVFSLEDKNKGELPKRHYKNVTIKRIDNANAKAMFHTEIEVLSTCKHKNIVSLLGFCDEDGHMILVYEGTFEHISVQDLLSKSSWLLCIALCHSIACGLNYIHNEMEDQKVVIHRQIRSNMILLVTSDEGTKISGFGLSTFLSSNQNEDNEHLRKNLLNPKTSCYMAPEFRESGKATKESDIYSFGLVMFEILCGTPYDEIYMMRDAEFGSEHGFKYGTIKQQVNQTIKEDNRDNKLFLKKGPNEDALDIYIKITEQCLAVNPEQRPTIQVIVKELLKALMLQENHKDHLRMSFKDIESATQNFSNDIGGGGFGTVYRGELASEHGPIAIVAKRLDTHSQGDQQFYNELHILSEYKHENVIGLVGYNNDGEERVTVFEYAARGSLDNHLNDASLTWIDRLNICIDIARGLAFLHAGVQEHKAVIHRDMKTANILLFDDWKAKVAGFGLSLIYTKNEETDYVIDYVSGTPGYLDPVYQKSSFLTKESDIYSLGVVLFEILYGKSTYEIKEQENQFLHSLVKRRREERRLDEVVFNDIKNQIAPEALVTFQAIGYQCLHDDRDQRPTAQHVLVQLQKALELQSSSKFSVPKP